MLEVKRLAKSYPGPAGTVRVLSEVSFSLAPGVFAALRGPSGGGKTTLLLALGGLLRPSGGEILVAGVDPWRLSPAERAAFRGRAIGFVFQQFHLVPYLTVLDNVLTPVLAGVLAGADERARTLLGRLGLESRAGHLPAALSTGERQRAALARALLRQPKLLLADEPTGNLDAASAAMVADCLAAYAQTGAVVLLVTHDDRAAARAGRQLRLVEGRVEE